MLKGKFGERDWLNYAVEAEIVETTLVVSGFGFLSIGSRISELRVSIGHNVGKTKVVSTISASK